MDLYQFQIKSFMLLYKYILKCKYFSFFKKVIYFKVYENILSITR